MSIEQWSENIIVVEAQEDPQFTDDMDSVAVMLTENPNQHVAINFASVNVLNSSNIAKLLKLRKMIVINGGHQLKLCSVNTHVWGVFLVTGLDKVFDFADELALGLAGIQIEAG